MKIFKRDPKWYGYRRDTADARDHIFHPTVMRLPAAVDLRPHCPPVMDQGNLGSCTAHGITGALRYSIINSNRPDVALSRLQLYYDERVIEGSVGSDAGAEIRDGIKVANKIGVAREKFWPYTISKYRTKPSAAAYKDAFAFTALTYQRVSVSVSHLKAALAGGLPVVIGVSVYESFESEAVTQTGVLPMPGRNEEMIGGHCMYVVGYGQKHGYFTVRNSWAVDWGDKGDLYMPESYLGSPKYGSDYWVIMAEGAHVG